MLEVTFRSLRGTRIRVVRFDLWNDDANALCAVTHAWKNNQTIIGSQSSETTEGGR